jgi:amino acid transporter
LLGYSRIPYAAARDGNFFGVFAHLNAREHFPDYSLLLIGACAAVACLSSRIVNLIQYLLVLQIFMKFVPQICAQSLIRFWRKDIYLPFRLWFYPLPPAIALTGWIFIAITAKKGSVSIGLALLAAGIAAFFIRARVRREWPFALPAPASQDVTIGESRQF